MIKSKNPLLEPAEIEIWEGVERIFPLGKYSMAPILRATNRQKN